MIELSKIPNTSKLKELRGQINTMVDDINGNQMVVGQVLNPTVKMHYTDEGATTVNVSLKVNQLFALCMLKSNSVYLAQVFGLIVGTATTDSTDFNSVAITIPAVKLPNRTDEVSSFVTPDSLGFTEFDSNVHGICNTGVQVGLDVSNSTGSHTLITTNPTLDNSSTEITITVQALYFTQETRPIIVLNRYIE